MAYVNTGMQAALKELKQQDTPQIRNVIIELLFTSPLYVAATWDKEPIRDEKGNMTFPPDTHFSLLTIQTTEKQRFFPMFTSKEESEKWSGSQGAKMLLLKYDQYIPIVEMAQKDISGIVLDPYGSNIPFTTALLMNLKKHPRHTALRETKIEKGEKELKQMEGRIRGDIWYIEHWSFGLDLYIIYKTVANALHGEKNAY